MKVYIITSAKMEELYIEDWIKYHLSLGIDKIIINDNNDEDYPYKLENILKEYIDSDKVIIDYYYKDHILKNDRREQDLGLTYTWLYNKYKNEFDWAVRLDIDEYLNIPETNNNIKNFLSQEKFNNYKSIVLSWVQFNIDSKSNELNKFYFPISVQKRCTKIKNIGDHWFKCIIKSLDKKVKVSHHLPYFEDYEMCLSNGISVKDSLSNEFCKLGPYGLSSLLVNFNNTIELSKYAYIAHYRKLSIEEHYYKYIKIYDKEPTWWDKNQPKRDLYTIYLNSKNKN